MMEKKLLSILEILEINFQVLTPWRALKNLVLHICQPHSSVFVFASCSYSPVAVAAYPFSLPLYFFPFFIHCFPETSLGNDCLIPHTEIAVPSMQRNLYDP